MPLISDEGTPASCGHPQTGSSKVFVVGKGACRVGVDTAGGVILGPGAPKVFVENSVVSLVGDNIAGHGFPPHSNPVTRVTQDKVFAQ